ncbi:MAG: class I SAM-dependent methyltransferase, partial [Chloroflexi bacterium]|nr:class I SAM-dependent methyltransferase [Chloroflexota bacterium]
IYTAEYFLGEPGQDAEERVSALKRATAGLYLRRLRSLPDTAGGRLLEIGCGRGEFLLEARASGYDAFGLEISSHAATAANLRLGSERVSTGTVDTFSDAAEPFDVVAFADVVEHVRDPVHFLRRVHALLRPRGVALLITPSLASWSARVLGRHWMEYKLEHLFYFTPRSVRLALERSGFDSIAITPNAKVLNLDYIHQHFQRFPVPLISPMLGFASKLVPTRLAYHPLILPASGMAVTARRA